MKKPLVTSTILLVFCLGLLLTVAGCGSTSNQTNATIWGKGTDKITAGAKQADDAIAALVKSADIETPATLESGVLVVGYDGDSPPLEFRANVHTVVDGKATTLNTQPVGFETDLCSAVANKMGLGVRFEKIAWNGQIPALKSGRIDIVMSAMATSAGRVSQMDATNPYLAADLAICTSVDDRLADEGALKGKIVGVQLGSPAQSLVESIQGVGEVITYPQILSAFRDLADGKLDAVVAEEPLSLWILKNDTAYEGKYAVTGRLETGEGYAFWCKKDNAPLLAAMNAAFQELREVPGTSAGATSTTQGSAATPKSVYQLICAKWGLTGN